MADPRLDSPSPQNPTFSDDVDPDEKLLTEAADRLAVGRQQQAQTEIDAEFGPNAPLPEDPRRMKPSQIGQSIAAGMVKAGLEVKDFVMGEPNFEDKSPLRKEIEHKSDSLRMTSGINAAAGSISQFVTGLAGAGKILGPIKTGSRALKWGYESLKAAGVGAMVFDPHEQRLADVVEQFPAISSPVTEYLQSDPTDSAAEGRFKSAVESIGMDAVFAGIFALSLKGMKLIKTGTTKNVTAGAQLLDQANTEMATYASDKERLSQGWTIKTEGDEIVPTDAERQSQGWTIKDESGVAPQPAQAAPSTEAPGAPTAPPTAADSGVAPVGKTPAVSPAGAPQAAPKVVQGDATQATDIKPITAPKDITDDEVTRILDAADTATGAKMIDQTGSTFSGISPGGLISWTKVGGPAEVQLYVQKLSEVVAKRLTKAKGGDVLSDARVNKMVQARADLFDEDPALVMGFLKQQGKNANSMVADMEASYAVSNAILSDSYKMAQKIKYGALEQWGGDAAKAMEDFLKVTSLGVEMLGSARAMTANFGRGLRRQRKEFKLTPADIEKFKTLGPEALVEAVYHSQGNPKLISKTLSPGYWQRLQKGAEFLLINGPLWWYPTHVVNGISNLYLLHARPAEKIIGSLAMGKAGSQIRNQALKEYRFMYGAIWDGLEAGWDAYKRGDSKIAPHESAFQDLAASGDNIATMFKPFTDISSVLHNMLMASKLALGQPTRALGAVDETVKVIRYRAVIQARAAQEATDQGLKGQAAQAYISKSLDDSFDEAGQAIDIAALREAQATTFSQPLQGKTLGHTIQTNVATHPFLRTVFTYVRTPINALRYTWKMTPILNMAQTEFRNSIFGKLGPEAQAHAIGQMSLGALIMGAAGGFAQSGMLTGRGPNDPKLQEQLKSTGWRPYSFVWTSEDGKKRYLPIGRLDPVGMLFGIIADFHDISQHPDKYENGNEVLGAAGIALLQNILNRTYLMSVQSALRGMMEPDKSFGKWAGNVGEAMLPASSLLRGVNPDPYMREARTMMDHVLDNTPGYSNTLPPKRNALGEPITAQKGLWSTSDNDGVDDELTRIIHETDGGITQMAPKLMEGLDMRDLELEDGRTAFDRIQELAFKPSPRQPNIREALAKLFKDKRYQEAPDGKSDLAGTKSRAIAGLLSRYREAAKKQLLRESKIFRDAVTKRKRETIAAARLKRNPGNQPAQPQDSALGMLLDMFNLQQN
ncbi:hypothetical protein [Taklimakanibacter albus]|uniref:Uncharacterized protein n=1 Tax=Taklimakanibacter albus TaxID=2800327 RepID=A0ACC5RG43_9HYPH|nr:hypothetical protein [Aestuariivirga sp. YIM B02566]MBK1871577.1 hypothetical protein [Aestuariivirga sp. YIM B02566]